MTRHESSSGLTNTTQARQGEIYTGAQSAEHRTRPSQDTLTKSEIIHSVRRREERGGRLLPCSYDLGCVAAHTRNITPGITTQQEHR